MSSNRSRLDRCRCYVKKLDTEAQFTLHWGAHAIDCPAYQPSGDPMDRLKDDFHRARLSAEVARRG